MNWLDILIIVLALSSLYRGYHIGLVRQAGSTAGFVGGLFLGAFIASRVVTHVTDPFNRSLTSLIITLGISLLLMTVGEFAAFKLKVRLGRGKLNTIDMSLGSVMAVITLLFGVWLLANIVALSSNSSLRQTVRQSRIIARLDKAMPPATEVISALNNLIDPNGFPQVFAGLEPHPGTTSTPKSLGKLRPAVEATKASVVKVEGFGCGGIVEGSGFVIAPGEVVTNAHVIAGVRSPQVLDDNGHHDTRVVWFDPDIDLAVLKVQNLAGKPLQLNTTAQPKGTRAAALGYPGGGGFTAGPASIIDEFQAEGRNIYDQGSTTRQVYSIAAHIIPGNSGGPLIGVHGKVYGIVFATSTTYNNVGYVLTAQQVNGELAQAEHANRTVGTGTCSE